VYSLLCTAFDAVSACLSLSISQSNGLLVIDVTVLERHYYAGVDHSRGKEGL